MPYCTTCAYPFSGHGTTCPKHTSIYVTLEKPSSTHNHHQQHLYHDQDQHLDLEVYQQQPQDHHEPKHQHQYQHRHHHHQDQPIIPTSYIKAATTEFHYLAPNHAITRLTATLHPNGTRSLTLEANLDREQCPTCKTWFASREKLDVHTWEYAYGCAEHELCFRSKEDEFFHGVSWRHNRCFVRGCESLMRREGGWKWGQVRRHVRDVHWQ